jgi:hypothetical protein
MRLMGHPQKIRLDTQRSKYDVICHLLSSGCAEPCLFLGTDATPLRPQSAPQPQGPYFLSHFPERDFLWALHPTR